MDCQIGWFAFRQKIELFFRRFSVWHMYALLWNEKGHAKFFLFLKCTSRKACTWSRSNVLRNHCMLVYHQQKVSRNFGKWKKHVFSNRFGTLGCSKWIFMVSWVLIASNSPLTSVSCFHCADFRWYLQRNPQPLWLSLTPADFPKLWTDWFAHLTNKPCVCVFFLIWI